MLKDRFDDFIGSCIKEFEGLNLLNSKIQVQALLDQIPVVLAKRAEAKPEFSHSCRVSYKEEGKYEPDLDLMEDLIVDSVTAMEAIFLQKDERNKGPNLARRAAALISESDPQSPTLETAVKLVYDLRNNIVHADVRPSAADLQTAAADLGKWLRQAVVAFLRMKGEQQRLVEGVSDQKVRDENRKFVRVYGQ